jgi:cyclophilin family peptidyl-prolyl cis-trans isomerase
MRAVVLAVLLLLVLVPVAYAQDASTPAALCEAAAPAEEPETRSFESAEQVLEEGVDYRAIFCTEAGPVYIDLLENLTPITVNNFVFLAEQGYYNNTTFHRVIADFMVQGGDPEGTGRGGPGYQFEDEFIGFLHFDQAGWLAMANAGPGTNGSQFFITTVPTPHLDYRHTIFGQVLEGQENIQGLEIRDPESATEPGAALNTVIIITDPVTVATDFEPLVDATQDEVTAAFDAINAILPPDEILVSDADTSGIFTTEEVAGNAPAELQAAYSEFLSSHSHEYRAANTIVNAGCDLENFPFIALGYSLDAYASTAGAMDALTDEALVNLTTEMGYTQVSDTESGLEIYTRTATACDTDVVEARAFWQRGRFVATADITLPDTGEELPLDRVLVGFVGQQIYERALSDVLRPEIR